MKKAIFQCSIYISVLFIFTRCEITSAVETSALVNTENIIPADPVYFNEDSSIAVSDFLNQSLGIKKIVIQKGDYIIDFRKNPYGTIGFRMDPDESDLAQTDSGPIYGISVAIRIARIKSKRYSCSCCSGIGFKCGFVSVNTRYESYPEFERNNRDQRTKYASVSYNKSSQTLQLDFLQQVNWDEMEK